MDIKFLVILLIIGLVLGTYSISNYALAVSQGTGKLVPNEKISPPTSPPGFEKSGMTRVISSTTSEQEISDIQQKGCSVIHRLNHATSFFCPAGKVKTLDNVRPVRIYQPHDLDADIQIQADRVWNELGFDGSGVKVAILDTGVQKSHAELSNPIPLTKDFTGETGDDLDFNGHGTHVSGIVTADGVFNISGTSNLATGVAPGADIIVGKVCGSSGCPEDAIIAGIEWAKIQGADVMNLSLGGGLSSDDDCDEDGDLTVAAVNDAVASGIVATISSGNNFSKDGVSFPGCASGAIAVGAVNSSDRIARFANVGPAMDIVAPGVSILSTYSCTAVGDCNFTWYAYLSGTSMSSPHVAGVVALMLEKNPDLTVDQIKDALYSTAKKIGKGKFDGNGRVDAFGAVNEVPGTTTPPPTNNPPVLGAIGAQTVAEGGSLTVTITATDADTPLASLRFSQTGVPAFATFTDNLDGTATLQVNPVFGDIGSTITVTVTDQDVATADDSETFTLTVTAPPQAPVLGAIGAQTVAEGGSLTVTITATDADTAVASLSFSATGVPAGFATFANNGDGTATLQVDPGFADSRVSTITVTVTDGDLATADDSEAFILTVTDSPQAPVLGAIGAQTVAEGGSLTVTITATDADTALTSLRFSQTGVPAFATFTDNLDGTATLQVNPVFGDVGSTITVTVTDQDVATADDSEAFTLTVNPATASDIVEITKAQFNTKNGQLRVEATYTDPSVDLTVVGYGLMENNGDGTYSFRAKVVADPGGFITVESPSLVSDTAPVKRK